MGGNEALTDAASPGGAPLRCRRCTEAGRALHRQPLVFRPEADAEGFPGGVGQPSLQSLFSGVPSNQSRFKSEGSLHVQLTIYPMSFIAMINFTSSSSSHRRRWVAVAGQVVPREHPGQAPPADATKTIKKPDQRSRAPQSQSKRPVMNSGAMSGWILQQRRCVHG